LRRKRAGAIVAGHRVERASIEERIRIIAPERELPIRSRKPNPVFARGELTKAALEMLREAGGLLATRDMVCGALAAKGVRLPDRRNHAVQAGDGAEPV
jgi:hypothetical protein